MIIVLLLICYFTLTKYKQTTLICSTSLLFLPHFSAGIGNVKLLYMVCLFQILMYYIKGYWKKKGNLYPKWLIAISVFTIFCYLFSTWQGVMRSYISTVIVNGLCYFYYPYIVWKLLRTKEDVLLALKSLLIFFVIVGAYALVELIIGVNIYSVLINKYGLAAGLLGGEESSERFGLLRCNSLLPYSSALGMTSGTIFMLMLYLKVNKITILARRKELFLLLIMPFCVLLSGTRSQIVFTSVCMFPFLFYGKFLKSKISKTIFIFAFLAILIGYEYIFTIVDSIIHSDKANMGSSSDMRQNQFNICYSYFVYNPIWGFGKNYIWDYVKAQNYGLLGAESVWFQLMVDYGLMGVITYFIICLSCSIWLSKKSKILSFFPLAFLVGKTLSIVIGIELSYLLIVSILMYKTKIFIIDKKKYENRSSYNIRCS